MKDDPIATCPECSGAVKRLLYPVGVVFKGSGWYINDSRKPDPAEKAESKPAESKAESKTESNDAKAETKPTTSEKSESKPAAATA
jgi:predicted nucleic acid-binding Zn ribbon protein